MKLKIVFGLLLTAIIINMTYLDVGFNELLSREPIPDSIDPLSYDQNYPPILGSDIQAGEMKFDRLQGGTLNLGGKDNINGVFSLTDNDGIEQIKIDNNGFIANGGNFSTNDKNNDPIIDSIGLNSVTNFKNGSKSNNNDIHISTTALLPNNPKDVDDTTLSFTLVRPTNVVISFTVNLRWAVASGHIGGAQIYLNIDGVNIDYPFGQSVAGQSTGASPIEERTLSYSNIYLLSNGIHTIKLTWGCAVDGNTVFMSNRTINYIILGN